MISFTVQHVLVLRLINNYVFETSRSLHNLLFLVSAEKTDRQQMCFYDFVRTGNGAYSYGINRMLEDLRREKLIVGEGLHITAKGRDIYGNLASALSPFAPFCDLCEDMVERYGGNPEDLNQVVFRNIPFRRAKVGDRIFYP